MDRTHSVDQAYLRKVNQRIVLNNVFENDVSSRAKIAKALSMSKPAIADNLRDLIERGILCEIGEGDTSPNGGRRPRLIKFNENHKHIIAIDLNYKDPICALCNLKGEILREALFPIPKGTSEDDYAKALISAVYTLMAMTGATKRDIICIAICSPGVFDHKGKVLTWNPKFLGAEWCKVDYVTLLHNEFGMKVIVKNDVKAAAIGEWVSAYHKNIDNMILISCGVGIGIGLILNSRPFEGEQFSAGEIYNNTDPEKYADNKMFEHEVCMAALQRRVKEGVQSGAAARSRYPAGEDIGFEAIVGAYNEGDEFTLSQIESIALEIGCTLANVVNLLDIKHVVIAGEYLAFEELLLRKIERVFSKYCRSAPELRASVLGRYQGIYGLAHIVREWYFDHLCKIESDAL